MKLDRSPTEAVIGVVKRPVHILVVEDELFVRMSNSDAFRDEGYTVIEAFNADEAVDIFTAGKAVDLVFSDVRMPGSLELPPETHVRRTAKAFSPPEVTDGRHAGAARST